MRATLALMGDGPTPAQIEAEDWLRTMSWDLRDVDGEEVDTLDGLAALLGVSRKEAAAAVLRLPFGKAAPDGLRAEAEDEAGDAAAVETKRFTARSGVFNPKDHPRDRNGRFARVGATVSLPGGGTGKIELLGTRGRVRVRKPDGTATTVRAVDVDQHPEATQPRAVQKATTSVHKATTGPKAKPPTTNVKKPPAAAKKADVPDGFTKIDGKSKGRPAPPAKGTVDDPIDVQGDVTKAAELIRDGKHVRLNSPDEVATLLDRLREMVADAKAKGEKAPVYDLCNVSVPGTNLFCAESKGIPRIKMPQFGGEAVPGSRAEREAVDGKADGTLAFIEALQASGIRLTDKTMPASHLRASQSELDGGKVAGMMGAMVKGTLPEGAIFVSRDGYVIDGHHRWAAKVGVDAADGKLGDIDMPVRILDLDIGAALDYANAFALAYGIKPQGVAENLANPDRVQRKEYTDLAGNPIEGKAAVWREVQHPRDRVGRFAEVGSIVRMSTGGTGTVVGERAATAGHRGSITVEGPDGSTRDVDPGTVDVVTVKPPEPRPFDVATAEAVAMRTIGDQRDHAGNPKADHIRRVARRLLDSNPPEEDRDALHQIAWLHDTVEDTDTTLDDLRQMGASERVLTGVDHITKRDNETREDYIRRIARNPDAAWVKVLADTPDNNDPVRMRHLSSFDRERLIARYTADEALFSSLGIDPETLRAGRADIATLDDAGLSAIIRDTPTPAEWETAQAETERRARSYAAALVDRAKAAEPKVTPTLRHEVSHSQGELVGLDHVIKGVDSLTRKIRDRSFRVAEPLDVHAQTIGDVLRYTATFDPNRYTDATLQTLDRLRRDGYEEVEVETYWGGQGRPFTGINTILRDPGGQLFELQFHTPESWAAKQRQHDDYATLRSTSATVNERKEAWDRMVDNFRSVRQPPGAEQIGKRTIVPPAPS